MFPSHFLCLKWTQNLFILVFSMRTLFDIWFVAKKTSWASAERRHKHIKFSTLDWASAGLDATYQGAEGTEDLKRAGCFLPLHLKQDL